MLHVLILLFLACLAVNQASSDVNFPTYIINLATEQHKYVSSSNALKSVGFDPNFIFRYEGIPGKKYVTSDNRTLDFLLNPICKLLCPYGVVGAGLAHFSLLNNLREQIRRTDDENKPSFAMILEDDARPIFSNRNYFKEINQISSNAPEDWDLIMLFCAAQCLYEDVSNVTQRPNDCSYLNAKSNWKVGPSVASLAAYLINLQSDLSISKALKYRLFDHADDQFFIDYYPFKQRYLNVYKAPLMLFAVDNSESHTSQVESHSRGIMDNILEITLKWVEQITQDDFQNLDLIHVIQSSNIRIPKIDYVLTIGGELGLILLLNVINLIIIFYSIQLPKPFKMYRFTIMMTTIAVSVTIHAIHVTRLVVAMLVALHSLILYPLQWVLIVGVNQILWKLFGTK